MGVKGEMGRSPWDSLAFAGNILSSAFIIFINKVLMDPVSGLGFTYG